MKFGLIVQHHKLECPVEKWDYCIQGQVHSKGSKCQWENGISAFKVKVTAKVQIVSKCLSGQYLLNHRIFFPQTWYVYLAS